MHIFYLLKLVQNVLFIYCATNLPRVTLTHVLQAIGSDINYSWIVLIVNKSFVLRSLNESLIYHYNNKQIIDA